jgi:hypothetical protein
MAGCIGNVDLDLLSRHFMCAGGKEEQGSADDDEEDDQEKYGSRHRALPLGFDECGGFCPTFAPAV